MLSKDRMEGQDIFVMKSVGSVETLPQAACLVYTIVANSLVIDVSFSVHRIASRILSLRCPDRLVNYPDFLLTIRILFGILSVYYYPYIKNSTQLLKKQQLQIGRE